MLNIMFILLIIFLIANIMMSLCLLISKKSLFDREKLSAFECGFEQKSSSRMPFSLNFFLITIIFLIFDIEIALILPSISSTQLTLNSTWLIINLTFIIILIVGIIHEWNQGMLNWAK